MNVLIPSLHIIESLYIDHARGFSHPVLHHSLSSPIYVDIVKLSLVILNSKNFQVWLFPLFLFPLPQISLYPLLPPPQFLSSTHQSTTFPSPSLLDLLSTTHTYHFSIVPFHFRPYFLFPSFHSLFSLKAMSSQEGDFKFCPNKIMSIKNLNQDTLIPLIVYDRSSIPKMFFLLRFV